jgi:hypothetical protein
MELMLRVFGVSGEEETGSRGRQRMEWRACMPSAVDSEQEEVAVHGLPGTYAKDWAVGRQVAKAATIACKRGLVMQFIGDSRLIVDFLMGRARTDMTAIGRPIAQAHSMLHTLVQKFQVRSPRGRDLAQQVPRADNSAADAAANYALDAGGFRYIDGSEVSAFLSYLARARPFDDEVGLLWSFDGASRGNPGESSFGVCSWGTWSDGSFCERGMLLRRGDRMGLSTNNVAEAHGMTAALREALRWHFEVLEALVAFAERDAGLYVCGVCV